MAKFGMGVARGIPNVKISDEDFAALQQISGLQFPKSVKGKFEEIIYIYINMVVADPSRADTKEIIRFLQSIGSRARAFVDVIEKVDPEKDYVGKYQALGWVFKGKDGKSTKNLNALIDQMKAVSLTTDREILSIQEKHAGSRGRNPPVYLNLLLSQIGKLVERAGGRATAYWSEHDRDDKSGGQDGSAFTDLVYELLKHCPEKFRPKSKKALAAQIRRWSKSKNAAQKRTAD